MKVYWTDTAEEHLDAIHDYIALDFPVCTAFFIKRTLTTFPSSLVELLRTPSAITYGVGRGLASDQPLAFSFLSRHLVVGV